MSCSSDWELPCVSSGSSEQNCQEEASSECGKKTTAEKNMELLQMYVEKFQYRPVPPVLAPALHERLAVPRQRTLYHTYLESGDVAPNKLWKKRLARHAQEYSALPCELLADLVIHDKAKRQRIEAKEKLRQQIYLKMLNRLERQRRVQYITMMMHKFASYVAKLATTMRIPLKLEESYARMHHGLFGNILQGIGLPPEPDKYHSFEYEPCYKLAHALLSLIVNSIDMAAAHTMMENPEDFEDAGFNANDYLKKRLMCAASKKLKKALREKKKQKQKKRCLPAILGTTVDKAWEAHGKCAEYPKCYA